LLRQIYIIFNKNIIFSYSYALAFNSEQFKNVQDLLNEFIDLPIPNQFFHRPFGNYQLFYITRNNVFYLIIADLVDKSDYVNEVLNKIIKRFQNSFPNSLEIKEKNKERNEFTEFLKKIHYELHSKIALIGPYGSGKTTIANLLKLNFEPKIFMNFAKSYKINIDNLNFDLWDFQLEDNFSPLWNKFLSGADLILLVFDSTNYKTKILTHFINLQKTDAKFSKLIIFANKQDLSETIKAKQIEDEYNFPVFGISLKDSEIKNKLINIISNELKIKKEFPSEFNDLLKIAENEVINKRYLDAINHFNHLKDICKKFQEFIHLSAIEQKISEIEKLIEKEKKEKEVEKFKVKAPEKISFSQKVLVKPLPPQVKTTKIKTPEEKPTKEIEKKPEKQFLKPQDIKVSLDTVKKDSIMEKSFDTLESELFYLIKEKQGNLSLKLCKTYVEKLQNKLKRSLTSVDLNKAAEIYLKRKEISH